MQKKIAVIAGDGVGPEIIQQSIKALNIIAEQYGHQFRYSYCLMGSKAVDRFGTPLPAETIDTCINSDAVLLGGVGNPRYDSHHPLSSEQGLRQLHRELGLFAGIRPVFSYPTLYHLSPLKSNQIERTNLTVIRNLTTAVALRQPGVRAVVADAVSLSESYHNTRETSPQAENGAGLTPVGEVAALAFRYARSGNRKLTLASGRSETSDSRAWKLAVEALADRHADVELNYMYTDQVVSQLVLNPSQFGVILAESESGKILGEAAAAVCGPVNLLASAAMGHELGLFRPVHGSYPQWAGKDVANPLGALLSIAMMLDYFQLQAEADLLRQAVNWTLSYNFVTRDIDATNSYSTSVVGDLICEFIENRNTSNINPNNISLSHSTII